MNVRCWCWGRWQRLIRLSVVFFLLGIVVEYPHLQSQSDAKNLFSVIFESTVRKWKIAFQSLSVSVHRHPISLFFNHSHGFMALNRTDTAWVIPNDSASSSCVWLWSSSSNVSILCLRIFLAVQSEACLQRWNLILETSKSFPTWFTSWSSVTINFDKHSMLRCGFSRTFLPIKAENQNLSNAARLTQNSTFQTQ